MESVRMRASADETRNSSGESENHPIPKNINPSQKHKPLPKYKISPFPRKRESPDSCANGANSVRALPAPVAGRFPLSREWERGGKMESVRMRVSADETRNSSGESEN